MQSFAYAYHGGLEQCIDIAGVAGDFGLADRKRDGLRASAHIARRDRQ